MIQTSVNTFSLEEEAGSVLLFHWKSVIQIKIKMSLCMPWSHMSCLTLNPGTRWWWEVGFTPRPLYPPGKYALNRLGGPRRRFGGSPTSNPLNELHWLPQKRQSTIYSDHNSHGRTIWCGQYTGCFTTLGHNCRRWFPRSLWSKKFI